MRWPAVGAAVEVADAEAADAEAQREEVAAGRQAVEEAALSAAEVADEPPR